MPSIRKIKSGLMFKEKFDGNGLIWQLFPNDSNVEIDNGFKIKASDRRVMLLTEMPQGNFIMQAKIKHEPLSKNNYAGVILFKDNESWVECQSYWNEDTEKENEDIVIYPYIKILKKNNLYTFYASTNGEGWTVVGTSRINDVNLIGFFFEPNSTEELECLIEDICFFTSLSLNIVGMRRGDVITVDNDVKSIAIRTAMDNNTMEIQLLSDLMPINNVHFKITDVLDNIIIEDTISEIYSGDTYKVTLNIELYIINELTGQELLLVPGEFYDFGHMVTESKRIKMCIINTDKDYTPKNINLWIEEYSVYYRGKNQVTLAIDNLTGMEETFEWNNKIILPQLNYNQKYYIWMKITKDFTDTAAFSVPDYRYKIVMT